MVSSYFEHVRLPLIRMILSTVPIFIATESHAQSNFHLLDSVIAKGDVAETDGVTSEGPVEICIGLCTKNMLLEYERILDEQIEAQETREACYEDAEEVRQRELERCNSDYRNNPTRLKECLRDAETEYQHSTTACQATYDQKKLELEQRRSRNISQFAECVAACRRTHQ